MQDEIAAFLDGYAPHLGDLYRGALRLLADNEFPGRARLIAHGVREIRNQLPMLVAGIPAGKGYTQYPEYVERIYESWDFTGSSTDIPRGNEATRGPTHNACVHIPAEAHVRVEMLLGAHSRSRSTNRQKAREMFRALQTDNAAADAHLAPIINAWFVATDWAQGMSHNRENNRDDDLIDDDFKRRFADFEFQLHTMATSYFGTMDEIDDVLAEANK